MSIPYHLAPLPAGVRIPDGRQHTGYYYRALNRRVQLTLRPDGRVIVVMRRLMSRADVDEHGPLDTPTQVLRGRVLHTSLVLSMDAVSAFAHFANEVVLNGPPPVCGVSPVHGARP